MTPARDERWRRALQWAALLAGSAALSAALGAAGFPAALLLGPLLVAVAFGVGGATIAVPRGLFVLAQGVAGCLIARSVTPATLVEILADWPAVAFAVASTLAAAALVGVAVGRYGAMPRDAAIWGFLPGMAGAMVAMAHEAKVDSRLVAFMQYVRLLVVILAMSVVARLSLTDTPTVVAIATAPPPDLVAAAVTLAVAATAFLGAWLRVIPAGPTLVSMLVAVGLQTSDVLPITLPQPVLAVAYAIIGFQVGLRFSRATVLAVLTRIPVVVLGSALLVALCSVSAALLGWLAGLDALTAFLATVPGSIETVAIIAIASKANVAFVMALQTVRLVVVVLLGPSLARWLTRRLTLRPAS